MASLCKPLGQALTSSAWINPPQHESRGAGLLDFVFLQARDRGDSTLQPFATFSQYINPWKVTCNPSHQQLCTCVQVGRLKHLQFKHWEQELWGLPGADGSSAPPWRDVGGCLWALTLPSSTQIPSICHSAKPAGQMDMHTTPLKSSISYKLYVWPIIVRHTTEVWGGVSCSPKQEPLDYLCDA